MNPNIIPEWAAIDAREFYESLFGYPLHEAEVIMEDGKPAPLSQEIYAPQKEDYEKTI